MRCLAHSLLYLPRAGRAGARFPGMDYGPGRDPLSPKEIRQAIARTVTVAATLGALYLLYVLRGLVLTVFVAIIFASAMRPLLTFTQQRLRLPRAATVLGLYVAITLGLVGGLVAAVPSIAGDSIALLNRSPEVYARWYEMAMGARADVLARLGVLLPMPPPQSEVAAWARGLVVVMERSLPRHALNALGALAAVAFGLVVAYYWLEARDELLDFALRVLPQRRRARFLAIVDDIERVLGSYLGGQLVLSLLIGVASLVAFLAIGLPDAGVLAALGSILHVIPLIGATVGVVPPIIVAVSISPAKGLITAVTLLLIHQIENNLIAPRVLHRQVGLSPLLVIIALTAGATLGGVVGALVAIPAAGALWILARDLLLPPAIGQAAAPAQERDAGPDPAASD